MGGGIILASAAARTIFRGAGSAFLFSIHGARHRPQIV